MSYFIIFYYTVLFSFIGACKEFVLRCEVAKKNKVLVEIYLASFRKYV